MQRIREGEELIRKDGSLCVAILIKTRGRLFLSQKAGRSVAGVLARDVVWLDRQTASERERQKLGDSRSTKGVVSYVFRNFRPLSSLSILKQMKKTILIPLDSTFEQRHENLPKRLSELKEDKRIADMLNILNELFDTPFYLR